MAAETSAIRSCSLNLPDRISSFGLLQNNPSRGTEIEDTTQSNHKRANPVFEEKAQPTLHSPRRQQYSPAKEHVVFPGNVNQTNGHDGLKFAVVSRTWIGKTIFQQMLSGTRTTKGRIQYDVRQGQDIHDRIRIDIFFDNECQLSTSYDSCTDRHGETALVAPAKLRRLEFRIDLVLLQHASLSKCHGFTKVYAGRCRYSKQCSLIVLLRVCLLSWCLGSSTGFDAKEARVRNQSVKPRALRRVFQNASILLIGFSRADCVLFSLL